VHYVSNLPILYSHDCAKSCQLLKLTLGFLDQFPCRAVERVAEPDHHVETRVALSSLHETDVGRVTPGFFGQFFMGQIRF